MSQKNRIIIAVALIAIVAIIVGTAAALLYEGDTYASKLEKGYRYLEQGDYNNAILYFRQAIDMDESREDAYYGLYLTYVRAGQQNNALAVLRVGSQNTLSERLRELLVEFEGGETAADPVPVQTNPPQEEVPEDKYVSPVLNTDMLTLFGSANYGDYCTRYQNPFTSFSAGQCTCRLEDLGATLVYYDTSTQRVIDTSRNVPFSTYLPNEISLDNVTALFGVSKLSFEDLKKIPGVAGVSKKDNTITFIYGGCDITIICGSDGMITSTCENKIVPNGKPVAGDKKYTLSTTVVDATTNAPVVGAKIKVFAGYNTFGDFEEATTDSAGKVVVNLKDSGMYTVEISRDGYITEKFEVQIMSNLQDTQKSFYISPVLSDNAIRFVLSWGASPSDLDCHLEGRAGDGTYTHIYFSNMYQLNGGGQKIAELDVDDTNSFGPETVTLYDMNGSFDFYIDDYTNSGTISASGATVKIYVGSALYSTVVIPAGVSDLWHVCTVSGGTVTVTNRGM